MPYADKDQQRASHAAYRKRTPDKQREYQRRYQAKRRAASPELMREAGFKRKLRESYGMSVDDYNAMLESQSGLCAICGDPETAKMNGRAKRLAVDHCHETNKVRGLLCSKCNVGLGQMRDSIAILELAQNYLQRSRMD